MSDALRVYRVTRRRLVGAMAGAGIAQVALAPTHAATLFGAATGGAAERRRIRADDVENRLAAMTSQQRAAQMFMVPVAGVSLTSAEDAWLRAVQPGGVILVGANFGTPDEVRSLVAAIHATNPDLPPLVALDQEGGLVSRLAADPAPDASTMGGLPPDEIAVLARARAELLASYGFDVNFAPVADVAFTPESFMAERAFGASPQLVAADVTAYLDGVAGTGVLHCVKHFPGHGRVSIDSHEALPRLDVPTEIWWAEDALPFRVAVDSEVPMVMLGHLIMPAWGDLPASLSPGAVSALRDDLGFTGVVVSDDLGMGALSAWQPEEIVDLAVAAGVDLLLFVIAAADPATFVMHLAARMEDDAGIAERVVASVSRLLRMQVSSRPGSS